MYWPYRGGDHCGSRINGSRTVAVVRRWARAIARTAPPIMTVIMAAARSITAVAPITMVVERVCSISVVIRTPAVKRALPHPWFAGGSLCRRQILCLRVNVLATGLG
jgi:hypothetical protein